MDPVFHSLVPNRELEELRRDAERWRALAPHLRACRGAWEHWLAIGVAKVPTLPNDNDLSPAELVDRLVQQRAAGGGKEGA